MGFDPWSIIAGPIAGWATKQLFGGGAAAPPKNPYADQLSADALKRQQMGTAAMEKYLPLYQGAAESKINSLRSGYGQNQAGKIYLGQAQTGADRAYGRANSQVNLGLARRGIGGGIRAGANANLQGQRANTIANTYNTNALRSIDADRAAENEIFNTYGQLFNAGNVLSGQGGGQLQALGAQEQQRLGQGQDAVQQAIQQYFMLEEMRKQREAGAGGPAGGVTYGSNGRYTY